MPETSVREPVSAGVSRYASSGAQHQLALLLFFFFFPPSTTLSRALSCGVHTSLGRCKFGAPARQRARWKRRGPVISQCVSAVWANRFVGALPLRYSGDIFWLGSRGIIADVRLGDLLSDSFYFFFNESFKERATRMNEWWWFLCGTEQCCEFRGVDKTREEEAK